MRHAFNCYLTSGNEPEKRTNSRAVRAAKRAAISSDSYADERKDAVRASVSTRTIDYRARSDIVTLSGRSVVRQVDGNGVARSDDLLRARIRKKLISVLPLTIDAYVQKTEVYHSALQTTYRLSTIRYVPLAQPLTVVRLVTCQTSPRMGQKVARSSAIFHASVNFTKYLSAMWKKVMARTTRSRRKMANTTDAPSPASSLLSSTTTTPFTSPTSTSYSTEGYTFNYSGLPSLGGYSLEDLNYTELWVDVWNSTEASNVTERLNTTVLPSGAGYCDEWEAAQHKLFQAANLFFAAAFLVPRSFKASVLALRTLLTAGFMLAALWAGITICALDAMLWCLALGLLNGIHSLILACRFLPPALSPELAELYLKLFKPYKVSKKHFQELAKEARILKLDSGQTYATEGVTPADERLSILLRGKLKVTCDGTHLHYIKAYQFVDSPEWEAMHENIDDVFQVTIRAEESSTYICWTRLKLLRVLRHRPLLKVVLNTLIGKDITSKLYALNEQLAGVAAASETTTSNPYRGVARSLSVDAVNTETAGRVRSTTWKAQRRHSNPRSDRSSPSRYSHQYWAPVVANHFPPNSPFTQGQSLGYTLLPQGVQFSPPPRAPFLSHQPLTRQRSGGTSGDYTLLPQTPKLERKRSKKGTREVTFETPV